MAHIGAIATLCENMSIAQLRVLPQSGIHALRVYLEISDNKDVPGPPLPVLGLFGRWHL